MMTVFVRRSGRIIGSVPIKNIACLIYQSKIFNRREHLRGRYDSLKDKRLSHSHAAVLSCCPVLCQPLAVTFATLMITMQGEIVLPFYSTTCACGAADKQLGFDETYHSNIAERFTQEEWTELIHRCIRRYFVKTMADRRQADRDTVAAC